jgi:hypothetical protein
MGDIEQAYVWLPRSLPAPFFADMKKDEEKT